VWLDALQRKGKRIKVYLMTKEKVNHVIESDDDYLDDDELSKRMSSKGPTVSSANKKLDDSDVTLHTDKLERSKLIGSSTERRTLREEQNKELMESLHLDQEKARLEKLKVHQEFQRSLSKGKNT